MAIDINMEYIRSSIAQYVIVEAFLGLIGGIISLALLRPFHAILFLATCAISGSLAITSVINRYEALLLKYPRLLRLQAMYAVVFTAFYAVTILASFGTRQFFATIVAFPEFLVFGLHVYYLYSTTNKFTDIEMPKPKDPAADNQNTEASKLCAV